MSQTEQKLIETLRLIGPSTRGTLCLATGIKWTTAYDALARLLEKGQVTRQINKRSRGRPNIVWSIINTEAS
jgi:predicted ArsR family transcriptional regulator